MSRTAATMFRLLMRHAENVTVRNVSTTPSEYDTMRLRADTLNTMLSPNSENRIAITRTMPSDTATPSPQPTAAAMMLYAMPSERNTSVRCSRFVPTARIMPISTRRSAASITKIRKMSIMPAAIEKSPSTTKNVVRKLDASFA